MYKLCLFIILTVATIDEYCLLKYVTYETELNPCGKLLIKYGGTSLFAAAKFFGTGLIIFILTEFQYNRVAKIAAPILAIFQIWLIYFMFFY